MAEVLAKSHARALMTGLSALLVFAACGGGTATPTSTGPSGSSTDVTVWTAWGGQELKAFNDVLAPFEQQTGIKVHVTTQRSDAPLSVAVDAGSQLPDVAAGPSVDKLDSWVKKGVIKPLETYMEGNMSAYMTNTAQALVKPPAGQSTDLNIGIDNGKHYELMIKTQVKGLFWYSKHVFTGTAPKTYDDLLAINPSQYGAQKLFCVGLASGDASGWPASDMIDNIIMRQSGDTVYNKWIAGKQKWTSNEIKLGYQTFLKEVSSANVYGGPNTVLSTAFGDAGTPLFKNPPGCLFLEQATFITNFFTQNNPSLKGGGADFDFFPHPSMGVAANDGNVNGFYDQLAEYNDTPAARKLMQYFATAAAQQIWVNDGGTLAANTQVTNYPDAIFAHAAQVAGAAKNLEVTAGDFMPQDMRNSFWKSLLNVTKDPSSLDSELQKLDQVQAATYGA